MRSLKLSQAGRRGFAFPITWLWLEAFLLRRWSIPLMILVVVFLFNLPYLFVDMLWHDDGLWYFYASEGVDVHKSVWRGRIATLAPYRDWLYSYGMVYLGLPVTRAFFVLIMATSSILLYKLYHQEFGIRPVIAFTAAVIPNILPSLKGIPVGLNASYAMWGLLPLLGSLLLLSKSFRNNGLYSVLLFVLAFCSYALALNLTESANFLIPCIMFFFLMFFPGSKIRSIVYGIPFLVLGLWQVYKQSHYSHLQPAVISVHDIFQRTTTFLEMSSFLPFNKSFSAIAATFLIILGLMALVFRSDMIYRQPMHFAYKRALYGFLFLCWPVCWMFANSLAYLVFNPDFRPYDYAYIFNFGSVMLQIIGLASLMNIISSLSNSGISRHHLVSSLLLAAVLITGIQRLYTCSYPPVDRLRQIRATLQEVDMPVNSQIIFLNLNLPHAGHPQVNSGHLRYITKRNDIKGLIGPDTYPANVFGKYNSWWDRMLGLEPERPVFAFRRTRSGIQQLELLLQCERIQKPDTSELRWTLFDIRHKDPPIEIASGLGMETYNFYIKNNLSSLFNDSLIAFAPTLISGNFIGKDEAEAITGLPGLLDQEYRIGKFLTLRHVQPVDCDSLVRFRLLLRADSIPPSRQFRLSYTTGHRRRLLAPAEFALPGDHMLVHSPRIPKEEFDKGVELGFLNSGVWPHQNLFLTDENGHSYQYLTLKHND